MTDSQSDRRGAVIVTTQGKKGRWFWKLVLPGHDGDSDRTLATGTGSYVDNATALKTACRTVDHIVLGSDMYAYFYKQSQKGQRQLLSDIQLAKKEAADARRFSYLKEKAIDEYYACHKGVRYGVFTSIAIAGILVGYLLSLWV